MTVRTCGWDCGLATTTLELVVLGARVTTVGVIAGVIGVEDACGFFSLGGLPRAGAPAGVPPAGPNGVRPAAAPPAVPAAPDAAVPAAAPPAVRANGFPPPSVLLI